MWPHARPIRPADQPGRTPTRPEARPRFGFTSVNLSGADTQSVSANPAHAVDFDEVPHFIHEASAETITAATRRSPIALVLYKGWFDSLNNGENEGTPETANSRLSEI